MFKDTTKIRILKIGDKTTIYRCEYNEHERVWVPAYTMSGNFDIEIKAPLCETPLTKTAYETPMPDVKEPKGPMPYSSLIREGDFGPFCPVCGSSLHRKRKLIFLRRTPHCINSECPNYSRMS